MTSDYPTGTPAPLEEPDASSGSDAGLSEVADTAQAKAAELKDSATDSGRHVVETAKEQAGEVADEVKSQAKDLLGQAREELQAQAREQQQRVASGLRAVGDQFQDMAAKAGADGVGVELVRQAADRSRLVGEWIGQRDPGSLLGELRDFARRRPGVFIAAAATAGILVGRLTRATAENAREAGDDHV